MRLLLLGDNCRPTLLMGLSPTQSLVKFTAPLMGLPPIRDDCGSTLLMTLFLTQSLAKFVAPLM